ncbi:MAG: hypothetical protein H6510_05425 [Acidobacteria bacterium]|nr:hypothetical protein [Acidobacteriota bacterium]MCB9397234.1 hypothetical protein [Acidobacteriota bacterium]
MTLILTVLVCFTHDLFLQQPIAELDLKDVLVSPYPNTLKMYGTAVDTQQHFVYTVGSQTPWIAQIDLLTGRQIGAIAMPTSRQLAALDVNPVNGFLVIVPSESNPKKAYLVDPQNSQVQGEFQFAGNGGAIAFDAEKNHIYIADQDQIRILSGETFSPITSMNPQLGLVGGLALSGDRLYVGQRNTQNGSAQIKVFSTQTFQMVRNMAITTSEPLGEMILDANRQWLILLGLKSVQVLDLATQKVIQKIQHSQEINDSAYFPAEARLVQITRDGYLAEGEAGIWAKITQTDLTSGQQTISRGGDYAAQIVADPQLGLIAWPAMHSGTLDVASWHEPESFRSIDIGESLDDMLVADGALYMLERLGGSKLVRWDLESGELTEHETGRWPSVIQFDQSLGKLFILNHYESTIGIHDSRTGTLETRIELPIAEGRHDAIGVMALDPVQHRLYACLPETETIVGVDAQTQAVFLNQKIPNFKFDPGRHAAIGVIQLVVRSKDGSLLVYQKDNGLFQILNPHSQSWSQSQTLLPQDSLVPIFQGYALQYDAVQDRIFIGAQAYNASSIQPQAAAPWAGRFLGWDNANHCLFLGVNEDGNLQLFKTTADLQQRTDYFKLYPNGGAGPVAFTAQTRLWIAEFNQAFLRVFDLEP